MSCADDSNVSGLMNCKSFIVPVIALLVMACPFTRAIEPNESSDRADIEAFTRTFLRAFENLDMHQFIACFAENATVFFPMPEPPERANGKQAIQQRFQRVFSSIRSAAKSGPPFHHLAPEDLKIQMMSGQTAVVSFHLRNSERTARRTLVLTKTNGQWFILHLHASNDPIEPKSDG
jgi:ketosteroid isomerase-like protein